MVCRSSQGLLRARLLLHTCSQTHTLALCLMRSETCVRVGRKMEPGRKIEPNRKSQARHYHRVMILEQGEGASKEP